MSDMVTKRPYDSRVRTRIKICGMMRAEDARLASRAGADAIGLIFHPPAPRNISIEIAREILQVLPAFVTPVGVFADADNTTIFRTVDALRLRHIQLNGNETPDQVAELRELRIIKAIRVDEKLPSELAKWKLPNVVGIVLETANTKEAGGTGVANDWAAVKRFAEQGVFENAPPIIAAGGLTPETVGEVVRAIQPFAVDVSSGVEVRRGEKSVEKIEAFVREVRDAASGD